MSSLEHPSPKQELLANFEQRSRDNFIFRLLWFCSQFYGSKQAIHSLPDYGTIQDYGKAITEGFNLEVRSDLPEWLQSENGQGVLIYGPHTYALEPFVLAQLLGQRELYFVAISHSLFMLPTEFSHMVLPVTPSHLAKDAKKKPGFAGIHQKLSRSMFAKHDLRTAAEMKQANLAVPQKAAELLKAGKVVIIFPAASEDIYTSSWNNGIGHIIANLDSESNNVLLQPFDITQITLRKAMRSMRKKYILGRQEKPTTIEVMWKPPLTITDVLASTHIIHPKPSEIAQLLAQNYQTLSH